MEKLEEARLLVIQAQANVTPLQHRIRHEEQRLQVLKAAFEAYKKKQQLQETLRNLVVEAAWAEIAYREQLLEQLESMIAELENDLEDERNQLKKLNKRRTELDARRQNLQEKRSELRETLQSIRDKQMQARGLRQGLERDLADTSAQISRYRKPKSKRAKSSSTKELVLREELRDFMLQRDELDDKLTKLSTRITMTEEELASEPQRFPRREEQILRACLQFRRELDKTSSGRSAVVGPIFSLIRIKRGQERFETAVKLALGRYAYAFLALNRDAFAEAKQLFDQLWSNEKPNLLVARLDSEEMEPRSRTPVKPPVRGWAADLLQGDPNAIVFLSRVINTAVADASADPNTLADAAQQLNGNIITSDGASHYLRFGAFTRPPLPVTVPFGIPLHDIGLTQDPRDILSQLQELRLEEARIARDRVSLNSEISEIRSQLQILQESQSTTVSDEDRNIVLSDLKRRTDDLQRQIAVVDEELETYSQEFQKCNTDIAPTSSRLLKIDEQLRRLDLRCSRREAEVERLSRDFQEREDELQGLVEQLKNHREAAAKHGPRPSKVRSPDVVRDERLRVEAMIETIPATEQDQKAFEEQEKLVSQLRTYLDERRHHIANLMTDVQRRLAEWRKYLEETIETLNHRMNQLLIHFLKQVRLTVRYPDEPNRAELHVQIAINRQGAWRTYDNMSGGERVLSTQTFILALHTLAKSPLHVIDEFTQRLDEASRAAVLSVVQRAVELSRGNLPLDPQFLLMAPTTVGLQIPSTMHHIVLVKGQVEN
jgi:chromosome segregation ATPase